MESEKLLMANQTETYGTVRLHLLRLFFFWEEREGVGSGRRGVGGLPLWSMVQWLQIHEACFATDLCGGYFLSIGPSLIIIYALSSSFAVRFH